ncbi:MAG: AAA family ATPase [Ruminococcus sp.]|nr:AAA family ATPase [Ruminococcus sp.]
MFSKKNRIMMIRISRGEKMKTILKQFKINGFRNLTNVTLNLNDITAIIGLNSYGKSNVIKAVETGIKFIKASLDEKMELMSDTQMFPLLKKNAGTDFSFEFTAEIIDDNDEKTKVTYGFTCSWNTEVSDAGIKEEHLFIKRGKFIERDSSTAKYKSAQKGRCDALIAVDENQLVLNKLENFDNLHYSEIVKALNNIEFYVERHLDASSSFRPTRFTFKNSSADFNLNDIPRTIWRIYERFSDKAKNLFNSFHDLFPTIDSIDCGEIPLSEENMPDIDKSQFLFYESIYVLRFKDSKLTQPLTFNALSDGTKRIFLTLTAAVLADIHNCSAIVFEEPENSIHPSLLQSYLRILDKLSGDCKIIFTSHSPYMIQYLDLNDIYIGLPSKSGETDFRTIKKPKRLMKDAAKFDQSTGDFIFESLSFSNAGDMLGEYLSDTALDIDDTAVDDDDDWLNDDGGDE